MPVAAPTIYDEALYGEPLGVPVVTTTIHTGTILWTVGDWAIDLPAPTVHRAPDVQRMIRDLRARTQWSSRQLATVLGTSRTTILNAEAGRPLMQARTGDLRRRVGAAHDVVERRFILAGSAPVERRGSSIPHDPAGRPQLTHCGRATPERAYLSAIDVLRPRPTGLLVGDRPRRGGATAALHD